MLMYVGYDMNPTERRRMALIGVPAIAAVTLAAEPLGLPALFALVTLAMLSYSFFYTMTYRRFVSKKGLSEKRRFYVAMVAGEFLFIVGLVVAAH